MSTESLYLIFLPPLLIAELGNPRLGQRISVPTEGSDTLDGKDPRQLLLVKADSTELAVPVESVLGSLLCSCMQCSIDVLLTIDATFSYSNNLTKVPLL